MWRRGRSLLSPIALFSIAKKSRVKTAISYIGAVASPAVNWRSLLSRERQTDCGQLSPARKDRLLGEIADRRHVRAGNAGDERACRRSRLDDPARRDTRPRGPPGRRAPAGPRRRGTRRA